MSSDILDVLPVSLDLIRIPRHRVPALVGAILRQLLASGDDRTFLALTANEIELSIFGVGAAGAFAPIARRDARKAASAAGQTWEPVEVSTNKWKVIQIPSPDDSGAHLHEVCAPIAAAGISILYHSSHQNDFIFVKELHLRDVLVLLAGVGFTPMDSTLPIEPISPTGAVLTRPHSNSVSPIGRSRSSTASSVQTFASALPSSGLQGSSNPEPANVRILTPTLTCIGLPSEDSDAWVLKLVKLITCPDLIIPSLSSGPLDGLALELDSPFAEFDGEHPDSPISPDSSEEDIEDEEDLADLPDEHFVTTSEGPTVGIQRSIRRPTLTHRATLTSSDPDRPPNRPTNSRAIAAAPYFSFTRAPEGASLTSSVSLLAALFPSGSARFGLSCANALDTFDGPSHSRSSSSSHGTARGGPGEGRLCLQIDLRKYALDAHGLVHRFTTALAAHQIEHVYSSTFRTANILVNSDDAEKASALIALC